MGEFWEEVPLISYASAECSGKIVHFSLIELGVVRHFLLFLTTAAKRCQGWKLKSEGILQR